ncbi:Protein of unknown function [Pyronema omphalodes CBS 100304]|uniref:Uncharacterized protein n=1 Tax=Pyronema omphalodes (strain CBS 100304) TaxID=1076935 RepID=U4LMS9_PYROM|nr:Protein of unknown function [Pyronema omphalodes CBS 100304]
MFEVKTCRYVAESNVAQQGTIIGTPKNKTKLMMAWSEGGVAWCDHGGIHGNSDVMMSSSNDTFVCFVHFDFYAN